jgi:hypothetical protein
VTNSQLSQRVKFAREELGKNPLYKFAGMIYHDGVIGTKIRLEYRIRYLIKKFDSKTVNRTVLFHPDKPDYSHVLYKICHGLGCTTTSSTASRADLVVAYEDTTKRSLSPALAELSAHHRVVNLHCDDISKVRVEEVFRETFGYGTFVDPTTHVGPCVAKSDDNAMHDGRVIECPVTAKESNVVYQRVINNTLQDEVLDIRVPVINGDMPLVYLKYRSLRYRFSNTNTRATLEAVESVFSSEEISQLKRFAGNLGLDFGELDVLRDVDDGRIYVVDVNNTPCGPPNHLGKKDSTRAIQALSNSFHAEFLARTT